MTLKVVYVRECFFYQGDLREHFHTNVSYEFGFLEILLFEIYLQNLTLHFVCQLEQKIPADIYFFKVRNGNTTTIREIRSKLTIKTLEQR